MTTLHELRDMLRAANGPSRELDYDIEFTLVRPGDETSLSREHARFAEDSEVIRWTSSIDAALALVKRLLPGWEWTMGCANPHHHNGNPWCCIVPPLWEGEDELMVQGNAPTAPLAILRATVEALIAREESK